MKTRDVVQKLLGTNENPFPMRLMNSEEAPPPPHTTQFNSEQRHLETKRQEVKNVRRWMAEKFEELVILENLNAN